MSRTASPRDPARGGWWNRTAVVLAVLLLAYYAVPATALLTAPTPGAVLATLADPAVQRAARTSLLTATVSTALSTLLGVPLGYRLARSDRRGGAVLTALVAVPLVLPPVVSGMLLVALVGSAGPVTALLGTSLSGTLAGVVLAQTFVASPFVVFASRAAIEAVDPTYEETARTLGRSPWGTFRSVTLPLAWRGVFAGVTLAFARSLGEFGATLMLAYYPRTMPVQIWTTFVGRGLDAAFPVALVLLLVSLGALVVVNLLGWRPR